MEICCSPDKLEDDELEDEELEEALSGVDCALVAGVDVLCAGDSTFMRLIGFWGEKKVQLFDTSLFPNAFTLPVPFCGVFFFRLLHAVKCDLMFFWNAPDIFGLLQCITIPQTVCVTLSSLNVHNTIC